MNVPELRTALSRAGVNPGRYDIEGGIPRLSEGLVLRKVGVEWHILHFERGSWWTMDTCSDESEACLRLLELLSDPFYKRPDA